jgi:hypothetical protein
MSLSQIYSKDNTFSSIPIKAQTCLETLPMFNYVKQEKNYKKHTPYLNANENEGSPKLDDEYLKQDDIPKYFSNKK